MQNNFRATIRSYSPLVAKAEDLCSLFSSPPYRHLMGQRYCAWEQTQQQWIVRAGSSPVFCFLQEVASASHLQPEVVRKATVLAAAVTLAVLVAVVVALVETMVGLTDQKYLQLTRTELYLWLQSLPSAYEEHQLGLAAAFVGQVKRRWVGKTCSFPAFCYHHETIPAPELRAEVMWRVLTEVAVVEVASGDWKVRLSTDQQYWQLKRTELSLWSQSSLSSACEEHQRGLAAAFAAWVRR